MNWEVVERLGGWAAVCIVLWWMMRCSDARHVDYNNHITTLIEGINKRWDEETEAHKVIIETQKTMIDLQGRLARMLDQLAAKIDNLRGVNP